MASSKVMSTTSPANPELPRQPSICSSPSTLLSDLHSGQHHPLGSMNMDDLFKSIYASPPVPVDAHSQIPGGALTSSGVSVSQTKADEARKEIVSGSDRSRGGAWEGPSSQGMTLEDFLTKAGAVREDGGGGAQVGLGAGIYGVDEGIKVCQYPGLIGSDDAAAVDQQRALVGRGKRRAVEEPPMDKATQRKQRRMIKNRESAARSRERKQAYTVELESLVTQLEEEKACLLREEAEQNRQRLKQLMESLIPVEEQRKPPRELRRVHSLQW